MLRACKGPGELACRTSASPRLEEMAVRKGGDNYQRSVCSADLNAHLFGVIG